MKMNNLFSMKTISVALVAGIALLYSCKKDNEDSLSSSDSQNVNSESASSSSTDETADITITIVGNTNDTQLSGARVAATQTDWGSLDGRLHGATITIQPGVVNGSPVTSTFDVPRGTITIDFGTSGTTDSYGIVRKGKIIITYYGRRYKTDSYRIIRYSGYSRTVSATNSNRISFDDAMVYTVTNVTDTTSASPLQMHHTLVGGKLTFSSDNTFVTRNVDLVVSWDRNAGTITHLAKSPNVTHSAYGTNRNGNEYTMDIAQDLVHKISCLPSVKIPVSGKQDFTVIRNSVQIKYSIDYGNGDCNNTIVVTIGTRSVTITFNPAGN